jgi:hypothetical protein
MFDRRSRSRAEPAFLPTGILRRSGIEVVRSDSAEALLPTVREVRAVRPIMADRRQPGQRGTMLERLPRNRRVPPPAASASSLTRSTGITYDRPPHRRARPTRRDQSSSTSA